MAEKVERKLLSGNEKITSPAHLKRILKERNLHPRLGMGQHFLIDENILHKILAAAKLEKNDHVLDLGAGPGALSLLLAEKVAGVVAVEWDKGLATFLREQACSRGYSNLHVIEGDLRRLNLHQICRHLWGTAIDPVKIVANLPYYLTTPLLFKLLQEEKLQIKLLVLMVQLEVARRILAKPGGKDYGTLSILCHYYTDPQFLFKVSRNVFYPRPAVDSAVVLLDTLPGPSCQVQDEEFFWKIIRAVFQKRRKTLPNALEGLGHFSKDDWRRLLLQLGISPLARGEDLAPGEFAKVANMFYN